MQDEELLQQIKDFTQAIGYVSVSSIQRKFMLRYEHSKQLIDVLIQHGFCEAEFIVDHGYRIHINTD